MFLWLRKIYVRESKNNICYTLSVAKASVRKKVSNLVLISSDKAVRPTNIMGASKKAM